MIKGIMFDNSRNAIMNMETVKQMICIFEQIGYNSILLYMEDTYEVNNQPYFGYMRGRYSKEELKEISSYGKAHNVEVIPCIQTLAHLNAIMRWEYRAIRDANDILCVGEKKTYELIEDIFETIDECFDSKIVNIGMDEAEMIGLGTYLKKHGYRNRVDIFMEHLKKVSDIARKYNFKLCMWSDMFYKLTSGNYENATEEVQNVANKIPDNVTLIYWEYFATNPAHYDAMIDSHQKLQKNIWFAGGLWTWSGFAPHNKYALKTIVPSVNSCKKYGVENIIFTAWGDNGGECSRFASLPSVFYNACMNRGIINERDIKKEFEDRFDIPFDAFMLLDLPGTPNDVEQIADADKYLLYNDCFMGVMDKTVRPEDGESYEKCSEKLSEWTEHPRWGYLFQTMKKLCDVLAIKTDIGIKVRNAYEKDDKKMLKELLSEFDEILVRVNMFYEAYEYQWMKENKPHGFDVQDIRIGGTIQRIKHCKKRLQAYLDGEITNISELEETILDIQGYGTEGGGRPVQYNNWANICSVNVI